MPLDARFSAQGWPIYLSGIAIEIQIASDHEWDNTIPGRLSVELADRFPAAEMSLRATQEVNVIDGQVALTSIPWTYLVSGDESLRFGVGKNRCHYILRAPQFDRPWGDVRNDILDLWEAFARFAEPVAITRAGFLLETQLMITSPAGGFDLSTYFGVYPSLILPDGAVTGFFELTADLLFDRPPSRVRVRQRVIGADPDERAIGFAVDFDHVSFEYQNQVERTDRSTIAQWLDISRQRLEESYASTIVQVGQEVSAFNAQPPRQGD